MKARLSVALLLLPGVVLAGPTYPYPGTVSPEEYLAQARARTAQARPLPPVAPSEAATQADALPPGVRLPDLPNREQLMRETEAQLRGAPLGAGAQRMPPMRFPGVPVAPPAPEE